jgi:hypothetical protein
VPRLLRSDLSAEQEKNMLQRFKLRAMEMLSEHPPDDDLARWTFLMQHHGLPTRLLDWSESALVALFFTVVAGPTTDGRLFILVPMALNESQIGRRVLVAPQTNALGEFLQASFHASPQPEKIVAVAPYFSHDRLARQRAGFTVHGTAADLQQVAPKGAVRSIPVPATTKRDLKQQLAHLGVTRTSLFHDLDALAVELREEYGLGNFE